MTRHLGRGAPARGRQKLCHPGPKNARILLVNLHQSSRSTFSWESFPSFFAFQEGMLDTQILALGGWPTVSARFVHHARCCILRQTYVVAVLSASMHATRDIACLIRS